ncbi:hypothetical protein RFI_32686, partial [Reticulomyxa filosa]
MLCNRTCYALHKKKKKKTQEKRFENLEKKTDQKRKKKKTFLLLSLFLFLKKKKKTTNSRFRVYFPEDMTLQELYNTLDGIVSKEAITNWLKGTGGILAKIIHTYATTIPKRSSNESIEERIKKYGYLSQLKGVKALEDPSDNGTCAHIAICLDLDFKTHNNPNTYEQLAKELSEKTFKKAFPPEYFTIKAAKEGSLILYLVIGAVAGGAVARARLGNLPATVGTVILGTIVGAIVGAVGRAAVEMIAKLIPWNLQAMGAVS